jgi:hypothetical protein
MVGRQLTILNKGRRVRQRSHDAGAKVALSGVEVKERAFTALKLISAFPAHLGLSTSHLLLSPHPFQAF